jgi:hypothetical protein
VHAVPRLFTPNQVVVAVLLGGPVALIYVLRANFNVLGQTSLARRVLILGVVGIVALAATVVAFPDVPNSPFIVAQVVVARGVATTYQQPPRGQWDFHTYWRAVGLGVISLVASVVIVGALVLAAIYAGLYKA